MHTLFTLLSIGLAALGAYLTLNLLQQLEDWASRRDLQFWVLLVPLVSLTLAVGALYHFVYRDCFFSAPGWDAWFAATLPSGMGLIALSSAGISTIRLALVARLVAHRGFDAAPELQQMVAQQAEQVGLLRPRLLICVSDRPLALSCGLWRPTLLLSTWMIKQLDARELEAVCAHKIAHAARRDYLANWLATMLRDAFYYLPTSRIGYRQHQTEKNWPAMIWPSS
ncbi:MAG: M56 family metallopeptidase [Aggregatilineales bacterium]